LANFTYANQSNICFISRTYDSALTHCSNPLLSPLGKLHRTADNNTHRGAKNCKYTKKSGPVNRKTLPQTATKEMFQVSALYNITKIGTYEYKDIAADCYKRNAPSPGIV
jgi:hypothetical protein